MRCLIGLSPYHHLSMVFLPFHHEYWDFLYSLRQFHHLPFLVFTLAGNIRVWCNENRKIVSEATQGKGFWNQGEKTLEGDTKQIKVGLFITEASVKAVLKIYPPLEKLGTKPVNCANV